MKCVVLLSGGMDSTVALYWAKANHDVVCAVAVDYGQRHAVELRSAQKVALRADVGLVSVGFSAPASRGLSSGLAVTDSDSAVVPGRNAVLLSLASAASPEADLIVWGASGADFEVFHDCRQDFSRAMASALSLSRGRRTFVYSPMQHMGKADTIRLAARLPGCWGALGDTWSCYSPSDGRPCGVCAACGARSAGFAQHGSEDPSC